MDKLIWWVVGCVVCRQIQRQLVVVLRKIELKPDCLTRYYTVVYIDCLCIRMSDDCFQFLSLEINSAASQHSLCSQSGARINWNKNPASQQQVSGCQSDDKRWPSDKYITDYILPLPPPSLPSLFQHGILIFNMNEEA